MFAQQQIGRGAVGVDHRIGRRLVDGEQRTTGIVPPSVLGTRDGLGRGHGLPTQ
ncbi:hypothetical protein [Brucella anthropi]|uniref:hypothetical protein n=1 Tax=Brucella anthropi TaxID=529 RepID=UPI001F313952|nr:hypothetical protein [Brucella anthropi]